MLKISKILLGLLVVALVFHFGSDLAYAAGNDDILNGSFGLSSVDSDLRRLFRGFTSLARPVVTIMTALAGMMVVLNIGGDSKQKIWNWILGIGLALNFGSVLWHMWGGYADITVGHKAAAEYSLKVFSDSNLTDGTIDTLSQFMKYYLTFIVSGAMAIKPIAIKLLLGLALADMSLRLALDLTDKDKVSWLVKNFLKIGFYVWMIDHWLGVDGLNLMDTLSKGFQEIGFIAGGYGEAPLTSLNDINGTIDAKHDLAPDSIVTNMWTMFSKIFASSVPKDAGVWESLKISVTRTFNMITSPGATVLLALSLLLAVIVAFLTAVEMFMARIEFYTLALLAIPLLAFGVIKHFEYLAQQAIRAVFNCGVKVCVISFLQAVVCQMFTKYTAEVDKVFSTAEIGNTFTLLSVTLQLLLMAIIMFLLVSKIPKLIQGLLSGNPSMSGSDMTGTVSQVGGTAVGVAAGVAGAAGVVSAAGEIAGGSGRKMKMSELGAEADKLLAKSSLPGGYAAPSTPSYSDPGESSSTIAPPGGSAPAPSAGPSGSPASVPVGGAPASSGGQTGGSVSAPSGSVPSAGQVGGYASSPFGGDGAASSAPAGGTPASFGGQDGGSVSAPSGGVPSAGQAGGYAPSPFGGDGAASPAPAGYGGAPAGNGATPTPIYSGQGRNTSIASSGGGGSSQQKTKSGIIANEIARRTPGLGSIIAAYENAKEGVYEHQGIRNDDKSATEKSENQAPAPVQSADRKDDDDDEYKT